MTILEIRELINMESFQIDFVAACTTQWHLTGIFAFLTRLYKERNVCLHGIIAIKEHPSNGYLLDVNKIDAPDFVKAKFFYLNKDDSSFDKTKIIKNYRKNNPTPLYVISANSPWLPMACQCRDIESKSIRLVVVDEGLSCYMGRSYWIKQKLWREKSIRQALTLAIKYCMIDALKAICNFPEESFLLLYKEGTKWIPNEEVIDLYREVINVKAYQISFTTDNKYAIFLTQPLVEDKLIEFDTLFEIYGHIDNVMKSMGIELYFKLHPREVNINAYKERNLRIIQDRVSAEEFIESVAVKPVYILGFFTTSLVSLKLFYGVKTISLNELLKSKKISREFVSLVNLFNQQFGNVVDIPTFDKLTALTGEF
ncbi:MAG: alpha-2,8-polysialyltransferase family protein [Bacteroides thetaiotaomicron]|nr:alpha-2,8-polysialyltransferase family protein [Bacteroides thetaiotaomicron]